MKKMVAVLLLVAVLMPGFACAQNQQKVGFPLGDVPHWEPLRKAEVVAEGGMIKLVLQDGRYRRTLLLWKEEKVGGVPEGNCYEILSWLPAATLEFGSAFIQRIRPETGLGFFEKHYMVYWNKLKTPASYVVQTHPIKTGGPFGVGFEGDWEKTNPVERFPYEEVAVMILPDGSAAILERFACRDILYGSVTGRHVRWQLSFWRWDKSFYSQLWQDDLFGGLGSYNGYPPDAWATVSMAVKDNNLIITLDSPSNGQNYQRKWTTDLESLDQLHPINSVGW